MKKTFVLAFLLATTATAADGEYLSANQIHEIASATVDFYRQGGLRKMQQEENKCWKDAEIKGPKDPETRNIVAACITSWLAATMIENTFARAQLRMPIPHYSAATVQDTLQEFYAKGAKAGLSRADVEKIHIDVGAHADEIVVGLYQGGML